MNKIKQKTYFNIVIFFSVVVAIFYIGNFYLIEMVKNLSLEVVDKKQKIERLNKQSDQIDNVRIGYDYIQKETDEVSNLIVDYQNIIDFIIEVENAAEKNRIDLEINVSKKERGYLNNNLFFVNYNIKARGDFDRLMHFLAHLENLKYLNKIENIRMYYEDKDKKDFADPYKINSGEIALSANLKVYISDKSKNLK